MYVKHALRQFHWTRRNHHGKQRPVRCNVLFFWISWLTVNVHKAISIGTTMIQHHERTRLVDSMIVFLTKVHTIAMTKKHTQV